MYFSQLKKINEVNLRPNKAKSVSRRGRRGAEKNVIKAEKRSCLPLRTPRLCERKCFGFWFLKI